MGGRGTWPDPVEFSVPGYDDLWFCCLNLSQDLQKMITETLQKMPIYCKELFPLLVGKGKEGTY